mgnify:CR=1 FL=1
MSLISKYAYYGRSIVTLLAELDDPVRTVEIFTGRPRALPAVVRLRRTGWRFAVRTPMDVWILKETCIDREYLWAIRELGEAWSVVDVGAGLGDFTVLAAKACPAGVVHAYEPLPGSFALLEQNLALNAVTNVQRFEAAVASRAGSLVIPSTDVEPVKVRTTDAPVGALSVPAIDLGAVLDALPDGRCDFLKVDCEGGEVGVFQEAARRTGTAVCDTDCELLWVPAAKLLELFYQDQRFAFMIARRLSRYA